MKKAVAHLIPFMEKEKEERRAQRKQQGEAEEEEVFAYVHRNLSMASVSMCYRQ